MQRIIALLVEFDEKTGRVNRYSDPASHWMRKAVAVCDPDNLRIFVKHSADWTYLVTVHLTAPAGSVKTSWVHEDGIRSEREQAASDHPVHKITCLSDLVAQHGKPVEPALAAELELSSVA